MARPKLNPWRETVRLSPQAPQLAAIARVIGVDVLKSLTAEVTVTPWMDGADLRGRFGRANCRLCPSTGNYRSCSRWQCPACRCQGSRADTG